MTLAVSAVGAVCLLGAMGQLSFSRQAAASIDSLEKEIATARGGVDWSLWDQYGQALRRSGDSARAATAFKRALTLKPDNAAVSRLRFDALLCVSQTHQADAFFSDFHELTIVDPKLAVDAADRPELTWLHSDARWGPAVQTARTEAAD